MTLSFSSLSPRPDRKGAGFISRKTLGYVLAGSAVAGLAGLGISSLVAQVEGWTLDRMPVVDRNLARIAVYEMLYVAEIDDPVAITEAVELARQMSTDDSPRFLNGILGRISEFATR